MINLFGQAWIIEPITFILPLKISNFEYRKKVSVSILKHIYDDRFIPNQ